MNRVFNDKKTYGLIVDDWGVDPTLKRRLGRRPKTMRDVLAAALGAADQRADADDGRAS